MGEYSFLIFCHMRSRGDGGVGGGGVVRRRGEFLVPKASLGLVGAILGPAIVLVEKECKWCGSV